MKTLVCLLKNLFGFRGYKVSVLDISETVRLRLKGRRKCGVCVRCGKRTAAIEASYTRTVRDLDMAGKRCFLEIPVRKVRCRCGYRGVERLDFVEPSHRLTRRMEAYVVSLAEKMSLKDAARTARLDWKTVKEIDRSYLRSLLPELSKLRVRRIAMDELAIAKGQRYVTIIRDYDSGVALAILQGRDYQRVRDALVALGPERLAMIEYVSMDMWGPYIRAITELCPGAKIVFDKFHVVKKLNEALDTVRKQEFAQAEPTERKAMKHKRFLILKKASNLETEKREALGALLATNNRLYRAYLLKEQLLSIFDDEVSSFEQVQVRLRTWFENTLSSLIAPFVPVVNMIQAHLEGVLNYFRYGMTNAVAEGFNTKANIIKRRAYGLRDVEYFILKIYQSSLPRLP